MYSVELRSGVLTGDTKIHTFLHITRPDGTTEAWGFYPAESGFSGLNGAGAVEDDSDTAANSSSGPIPLTPEQYSDLKSYIDESINNPPPYSLPFGSHCTTWALDALAEIGAIPDFLSPGIVPDNLWSDLVQTMIWNPLWQSIGFNVNNWFQNAFNFIPPSDSLTLDLDGDGIKNGTGWISGNDGILFLDEKYKEFGCVV